MQTANIYYFDHAAATPVDEQVAAAMLPYMTGDFFNPSSPYAPAVAVRRDYEAAKARLAATFGARGDDIVITAGATESINLAFGSFDGHIVTTAIEHNAVLAAAKRYTDRVFIAPNEAGLITRESVAQAITASTEIVSIQLANNEIGTVQPIRDIATVVSNERDRRLRNNDKTPIWLHCDASQGFGQIDVNVARLGIDLLTLNAAKMYGPKQVGLLWAKPGVKLKSIVVGGGQERGLRSGTENVAGTVGFSLAAELASGRRKSEAARLAALRDRLQHLFQSHIADLVVSGHPKKRLPGSLHISIPGLDGERLVFALERRGVMVATGSACAANKGTRSHVLEAIGLDESAADGSLRITLGRLSSDDAVSAAAPIIIEEIINEQRRISRHA